MRERGHAREGTKEGRGHKAEAEAEIWCKGGCEGRTGCKRGAGCKRGRGGEGVREVEREGTREGARGRGAQREGQVTMERGAREGEEASE